MRDDLKALFKKMAEEVSAVIHYSKTQDDITVYIAEVMRANGHSRFAAPAAPDKLCLDLMNSGFENIKSPLRDKADDIDAGIVFASYGIAETGTLVVNSNDEDTRLATMLSETNFVVLNSGNIVEKAYDISKKLNTWFRETNYTAFISGPSRTADIERVLTLGAHGPLQLHIILTNNK